MNSERSKDNHNRHNDQALNGIGSSSLSPLSRRHADPASSIAHHDRSRSTSNKSGAMASRYQFRHARGSSGNHGKSHKPHTLPAQGMLTTPRQQVSMPLRSPASSAWKIKRDRSISPVSRNKSHSRHQPTVIRTPTEPKSKSLATVRARRHAARLPRRTFSSAAYRSVESEDEGPEKADKASDNETITSKKEHYKMHKKETSSESETDTEISTNSDDSTYVNVRAKEADTGRRSVGKVELTHSSNSSKTAHSRSSSSDSNSESESVSDGSHEPWRYRHRSSGHHKKRKRPVENWRAKTKMQKLVMERATERAIKRLRSNSPNGKNVSTPVQLSQTDSQALMQLKATIPPHILERARRYLRSSAAAAAAASTSTAHNSNSDKQTPSYHISDISITLTAAKIVILQLSGNKFKADIADRPPHEHSGVSVQHAGINATMTNNINNNKSGFILTNSSRRADPQPLLLQDEVLRIACEREKKIALLEMEIAALKSRLT